MTKLNVCEVCKPFEYLECCCFQNQVEYVLDTLIQKIFSMVIKLNNFWGDQTDVLATKEALLLGDYVVCQRVLLFDR